MPKIHSVNLEKFRNSVFVFWTGINGIGRDERSWDSQIIFARGSKGWDCAGRRDAYNSPRSMNTPSARCLALVLTALLLAGCGKKESVAPVPTRESEASEEAAPVVKTPAAEADAAFLKEMKDAPAAAPEPALAEDRAAYEEWFKKYRLDLSDPKMLDADADGDGVSNRDEFNAKRSKFDGSALLHHMGFYIWRIRLHQTLCFQKARCKRRCINRTFQPRPKLGNRADVIFMTVCDQERPDVLPVLLQISHIGRDDINTR